MTASLYRMILLGMTCCITCSVASQPTMDLNESEWNAMQVDCNDFAITAINNDAQNTEVLQVSIVYNGTENSFINYPYIAALLDCNQDTIGSGDLYWFGQFGQSVQDYPVTVTDASDCGPFTAFFVYSNDNGELDTCALSFSFSRINDSELSSIAVYPNPFSDELIIRNEDNANNYQIFDGYGRVVRSERLTGILHKVDTESLPNGIYFIAVYGKDRKWIKVIKQ